MQKLNVILAILSVLTLQAKAGHHVHPDEEQVKYKINYTDYEKLNYTQEVDLTIRGNFQTFTLSKNESHIFVNSTNTKHFNPCIIAFKTLSYSFQVAPFKEKIILWDLRTDSYNVTGVTLLQIDPFVCNYTSIEVPPDVIPKDQPPYRAQVLTYKGTNHFDIFFGGRTTCMPCRFTDEGANSTECQLESTTARVVNPYLIRPISEYDPEFGYVHAFSFDNGSLWTEINLLYKNFTLIRRTYVNHTIDEVAIDDSTRDIVTCYKKEDHRYAQAILDDKKKVWEMKPETDVYCDVYNKYLEHKNNVKLSVPRDQYINGIFLSISKEGSLCVAVPHISYAKKGNKYSLSFFRFNSYDRSSTDSLDPLSSVYTDFDEENGYQLKVKASRLLYWHCS